MGKSNDQVIGYKYFTNFLLFIGNPIEKMLGINFDKRGWLTPLVDENGNPLLQGFIDSPTLYGETEGGVSGAVHLKTGTNNQEVVPFYKDYMESKELQASAYPYQSYLAFKDFYVGNTGYMKEMLLWPKRIHVRNDGRVQWYDLKAEIYGGDYKSDIYFDGNFPPFFVDLHRCQGFNDLKCNDYPLNSDGGNSDLLSGIGAIGIGTQTDTPPSAATASFSMVSSVGGFISVTIMVEINGESHTIKTQEGSYVTSMDIELIETIDTTKKFKVNAVFNLFKSKIFGFTAIAKNATPVENNQFVLGSRIYDQKFDGVAARSYGSIESPDINPIHKIREILTDDTAMNKPEMSVNNENFIKAADWIWNEGLGVSWSITEKACIDAINELCYHIEAGIRVNRQTGLYEMVLFRDNWFDEDEIHTIHENKIKKDSMQYEITNADEVVNQVNVNYYDRANIKNSSFSISESGLIQTLGRVNAETVDFPYFMNMRNAEIVANWKLKILSTGVLKGSLTTGWREARKWNRYDLIRLPWSKRWTGTILVRIMSINLGGPTNNEVSIEWVEVVPSTGMMNTSIVTDEPIDKPLPPQPCQYEPFELPYYLAVMALGQRRIDDELAYESNFGLVGVVAERPQSNSLYAVMMTNNYDEWVRAGSIQYSETTDLDQIISKTSSSFIVKNWKKITNIPAGTLIQCGKEWLTGLSEWMVFQGIDPNTGVVSVKRGALDTQPQDWDLGLKLYFCGNDISYDQTEYVSGEKVLVSALTTTPSGVLEQKGSNAIEMKARAIRPYPPANVKFNDVYFPETLIVTNNIVLNWAHRNRAQQTGGDILGWYDSDVIVESGVTYAYELISENVVLDSQSNIAAHTTTILASVLKPNKPHTLKLWSVRDGYDSYQKFEHSFFVESASLILTATATKSNVTGNTVPTANITVNVDESLKANMRFDGSSISGKALAGSTITIEVNE